jgi:hypothetical protein
MFKNSAVLALLGLVSADQIPLGKRNLTRPMFESQMSMVNGTQVDIIDHNDSEYYVNINIGTPGQPIEVVPSTIHSNTWVLGSGCTILNGCRGKTVYSSKKSSTYKKNGKKISLASDISGIISNDKVTLGGANAQMDFAEIGKPPKNKFEDSKVTGILGLGFDAGIIGDITSTFLDDVDVEESFELYLAKSPEKSYMTIPSGPQVYNSMDTHFVVEKNYWALHVDYVEQGTAKKILTPSYKVVLDSTSSLIHGPKSVMGPLIDGISVAADCSNIDSLPDLHFAIDAAPYTLSGADYVQKVDGKCQMAVVATEATDSYIFLGTPFIIKHSPINFNYEKGYVQFTTHPIEEEQFF